MSSNTPNTHHSVPPAPQEKRQLVQKRAIQAEVYKREDGLWDIEAELIDTKGVDFHLKTGTVKKGEPIHRMRLIITINQQMDILGAQANSLDVPYPGACETIAPEYQKLIGLNLMRGFRADLKQRFNGVSGCTHMTELCNIFPTAAIQAFAGEIFDVTNDDVKGPMPFQLNRCHALRTDGPAVKKYHPTWFGREIEATKIPKTTTGSEKSG